MTPSRRDRLKTIILEKSFANDREFTLASGKTSWLYFNMKPTMLDPEGADIIAELILEVIAGDNADYAGGLEMGAVPIAALLAPASHRAGTPVRAFFIRKQAKGYGANKLVEGLPPGETIEGKRVIVLEDVTTTGGSALKAIDTLREAGADIVRVITLVDRQEGAEEAFTTAGLTFTPLFRAEEFPTPNE